MNKILYFLPLLSLIILCQNSPEIKIKKHGVEFICPKGWEIVSEEEIDNQIFILIKKDGIASSGTIKIEIVNDSLNLQKYIQWQQNNVREHPAYANADIAFDPIVKSTFNEINALTTNFEFYFWNDMDRGSYYVMLGRNKSITILKQEAVKDSTVNKAGFEFFEHNFFLE